MGALVSHLRADRSQEMHSLPRKLQKNRRGCRSRRVDLHGKTQVATINLIQDFTKPGSAGLFLWRLAGYECGAHYGRQQHTI
jgi:hypothetical protein